MKKHTPQEHSKIQKKIISHAWIYPKLHQLAIKERIKQESYLEKIVSAMYSVFGFNNSLFYRKLHELFEGKIQTSPHAMYSGELGWQCGLDMC